MGVYHKGRLIPRLEFPFETLNNAVSYLAVISIITILLLLVKIDIDARMDRTSHPQLPVTHHLGPFAHNNAVCIRDIPG